MEDRFSKLVNEYISAASEMYSTSKNHGNYDSYKFQCLMLPEFEKVKSLGSMVKASQNEDDFQEMRNCLISFLENCIEVSRTGKLPEPKVRTERKHIEHQLLSDSHKRIESPKNPQNLDEAFDSKLDDIMKLIEKF